MNHIPTKQLATLYMLVKGKRNTDYSKNKTKLKLKCRQLFVVSWLKCCSSVSSTLVDIFTN